MGQRHNYRYIIYASRSNSFWLRYLVNLLLTVQPPKFELTCQAISLLSYTAMTRRCHTLCFLQVVEACIAKHGRIDLLVNNVEESETGVSAKLSEAA